MARTVTLQGGPFTGTEVEVNGNSLLCEGDEVPEGYVARYKARRGDKDRLHYDGIEKVIARIPAPAQEAPVE